MKEGWQEGRGGSLRGRKQEVGPSSQTHTSKRVSRPGPRLGKMWASVHTGTLREAHSPEGDLCLSITVSPPRSESEVLEGASVRASRRPSGCPAAFTPAVHPQLLVSASAPSKVQGSSSVCLPQVPRPEAVV